MTIQIGAFEVQEPVPSMREPKALAALQPWVDVGSVGTMALAFLEDAWKAKPVAQLARPGNFYDFTRYRPTIYFKDGQREVSLPNTSLHHAQTTEGQDWLLLHILEPHCHGEDYVDSLLELVKYFGVREYILIGSMYAPVPHTRPPIISGTATDETRNQKFRQLGVRESGYEGPTTVLTLLTAQARREGIDTSGTILQLPAYAQLEKDFRGLYSLLELLSQIYDLNLDLESVAQERERQHLALDESVGQDPRIKSWVEELEALYDSETASRSRDDGPKLSPELEQFLSDIERRWNEPDD